MPKPRLLERWALMESQMIATMLEGLHEWRPDLDYPESYSDMQGCVRALFRRYKIEMRPVDVPLEYDE